MLTTTEEMFAANFKTLSAPYHHLCTPPVFSLQGIFFSPCFNTSKKELGHINEYPAVSNELQEG